MIKPLRGKFMGEILDPPEKSKAGVYMVEKQHITDRVKILAVGSPEKNKKGREIQPVAEVGDIVYIRRWAGNWMDWEDKHIIFLHNRDIVGKYREEENGQVHN